MCCHVTLEKKEQSLHSTIISFRRREVTLLTQAIIEVRDGEIATLCDQLLFGLQLPSLLHRRQQENEKFSFLSTLLVCFDHTVGTNGVKI